MPNTNSRALPYESCEVLELKKQCGCNTCDCELSQDTYHKGCHTFNLFDQENDQTNSTGSGGLYDDQFGPVGKKRKHVFNQDILELM